MIRTISWSRRMVALVLVGGLLVDPALASSMLPILSRTVPPSIFSEQALSPEAVAEERTPISVPERLQFLRWVPLASRALLPIPFHAYESIDRRQLSSSHAATYVAKVAKLIVMRQIAYSGFTRQDADLFIAKSSLPRGSIRLQGRQNGKALPRDSTYILRRRSDEPKKLEFIAVPSLGLKVIATIDSDGIHYGESAPRFLSTALPVALAGIGMLIHTFVQRMNANGVGSVVLLLDPHLDAPEETFIPAGLGGVAEIHLNPRLLEREWNDVLLAGLIKGLINVITPVKKPDDIEVKTLPAFILSWVSVVGFAGVRSALALLGPGAKSLLSLVKHLFKRAEILALQSAYHAHPDSPSLNEDSHMLAYYLHRVSQAEQDLMIRSMLQAIDTRYPWFLRVPEGPKAGQMRKLMPVAMPSSARIKPEEVREDILELFDAHNNFRADIDRMFDQGLIPPQAGLSRSDVHQAIVNFLSFVRSATFLQTKDAWIRVDPAQKTFHYDPALWPALLAYGYDHLIHEAIHLSAMQQILFRQMREAEATAKRIATTTEKMTMDQVRRIPEFRRAIFYAVGNKWKAETQAGYYQSAFNASLAKGKGQTLDAHLGERYQASGKSEVLETSQKLAGFYNSTEILPEYLYATFISSVLRENGDLFVAMLAPDQSIYLLIRRVVAKDPLSAEENARLFDWAYETFLATPTPPSSVVPEAPLAVLPAPTVQPASTPESSSWGLGVGSALLGVGGLAFWRWRRVQQIAKNKKVRSYVLMFLGTGLTLSARLAAFSRNSREITSVHSDTWGTLLAPFIGTFSLLGIATLLGALIGWAVARTRYLRQARTWSSFMPRLYASYRREAMLYSASGGAIGFVVVAWILGFWQFLGQYPFLKNAVLGFGLILWKTPIRDSGVAPRERMISSAA